MNDRRGLLAALIGDGRPLLTLTALSLLFAGGFALFLTFTRQFLPHDVQYLHMSAAELCTVADCRINAFMFHDRAAFGGALIAVGVLYLWLIEFPLRGGRSWAWWTLAVTGGIGFLSFLAYLGYGYLDSWHGVGTLALVPFFVTGMARTRRLVAGPAGGGRVLQSGASVAFRIGHGLLLATALGMIVAGGAILVVGMTTVFVPDDLAFMSVTVAQVRETNDRLISLIAHDRAGFGGGLLTTGLIVGSCIWFSPMTRALRQSLWIAGGAGFGCAIGIHLVVGYTVWTHLGPAVAGAAMFVLGMLMTRAEPDAADGASPARLGATVIYVGDVVAVLDFYRAAFGCEVRLFDPDVQLAGRQPGAKYQFAEVATEGGTLHFGTPALGALLMPGFERAPDGRPAGVELAFTCDDVEAAFARAVGAGATAVRPPERMPWGQTVAYVRSVEGTWVGLCSPLPHVAKH